MSRHISMLLLGALLMAGCASQSGDLISREILVYEYTNRRYTNDELKKRAAAEQANVGQVAGVYKQTRKQLGQVKRDYALADQQRTQLSARLDTQKKHNSALAANIQQQQKANQALSGNLAKLDASLKAKQAQQKALDGRVAALNTSLAASANQGKQLQLKLAQMNQKLAQQRAQQQALAGNLAKLETQLKASQARELAMKGSLAKLEGQAKASGERERQLAAQLKSNEARCVASQNRSIQIKKQEQQLLSQERTASARVKTIRQKLANHRSEQHQLGEQLAMLADVNKKTAVMLDSQLQTRDKQRLALEVELKQVAGQIKTLESKRVDVPDAGMLRRLDGKDKALLAALRKQKQRLAQQLKTLIALPTKAMITQD